MTAVGTLAYAVRIGFFMQSGNDAQQRYSGTEVVVNAFGEALAMACDDSEWGDAKPIDAARSGCAKSTFQFGS
jgi:hypothetical protein